MLEHGKTPEEVKRKLVGAGLTEDSAKLFIEKVIKEEKESKRESRGSFVAQFIGIPIVIIGFLLVIGNITGLFTTFPYAGFIVIILGILIGGVFGYLASRTIR